MDKPSDFQELNCRQCVDQPPLDFDFTMAFQPIVSCQEKRVIGYEALARGLNNESAWSVISKVNDSNRYRFDQLCRVKAIALASKLGIQETLSINFLPNAVYRPELCIRTTLEAARTFQFPAEQIMFELTEVEPVKDHRHIADILACYQDMGFATAIDDFGSGYSGLGRLADFQPDIIKLDMSLVRGCHEDRVRQRILVHSFAMATDLGIRVLAEGVETREEMAFLVSIGIDLMQGYYFAKPGFEQTPAVEPACFPEE